MYEIRTTWWDPAITRVRKINVETREETLVAELERKADTEPRIRLNWDEAFSEFRKASEWLKMPVEKRLTGSFPGLDETTYRWIRHKGHLRLVKDDDEDAKTPLVTFHRHKRHFYVYWRMSKHASLEVSPDCLPNLDAIILSYLLVERMRRDGFLGVGGM